MSATPAVLVNSLPKSGTHLIRRVFEGLQNYRQITPPITAASGHGHDDPNSGVFVGVSAPRQVDRAHFASLIARVEPGTYLLAHIPHSDAAAELCESHKLRVVVLLRDPRAVAVSFVHYVRRTEQNPFHERFAAHGSVTESLRAAIRGLPEAPDGVDGLLSIGESFRSVARWGQSTDAHLVLFEDLVGPRGGGSAEKQLVATASILEHVGCTLGEADLAALCETLFDHSSGTFRRGRIDDWKQYFDRDIDRLFEEHAGEALTEYLSLAGHC